MYDMGDVQLLSESHHSGLIERALRCRNSWDLGELLNMKYDHHVSSHDHPLQAPRINSVYSSTLGPRYFAIKLRHFTRHTTPMSGHWYPAARAGRTDGKTRGRVRAHSSPRLSQIMWGNIRSPKVKVHILFSCQIPVICNLFWKSCIFVCKRKCFLTGTFSRWLSCYVIPNIFSL